MSIKNNYNVYIHSFPNGKVYIGQTKQTFAARWSKGKGYEGQLVHRAIEKYGWENIEHIIIATGLSKEEANNLEIELIAKYKSNDHVHGYNVSPGGAAPRKYLHNSDEHNKKIADSHKKRVCCFSREGEKIATFESVMAAADFVQGSFRVVSACCNGTKKSGYGYVWRFEHDPFDKFETKNKIGGVKGNKVIAHTVQGEFIGIYPSAKQASKELKVTEHYISQICRGLRAQSKGLVFNFYNEEDETNADQG